VLGSEKLTQYLVNFARSFIYTTGLAPHALATIKVSYASLTNRLLAVLQEGIRHFKAEVKRLGLEQSFINSNSAIHCCVISGNERTKKIAKNLQQKGFDVKAILSPTVAAGKERLRFCLHSYNTKEQITTLLEQLVIDDDFNINKDRCN